MELVEKQSSTLLKDAKDATEEKILSTKAAKLPQTTEQAIPEVNNPETNNNRNSWVWNHFKYVENMTETNFSYCKKLIRC